MTNRLVDIILILLILTLFISYFTIIDKIFNKNSIIKKLTLIEKHIHNENWTKAKVTYKELEKDWKTYQPLIMLNFSEAEFTVFEEFLSHIKGGLKAEDKTEVLSHTKPTKSLWKNIKRIVPQP